MASNPFFYVRHPAYVGMILFEFAISSLLALWWAIIFGGLCAILMIIRTVFEDRTLLAELPGCVDYARLACYQLFPGIW